MRCLSAEFLARERERSAEAANRARSEADGLMNSMLSDLNGKLAPLGELTLLADVAKRVSEYFQNLPKDEIPQVSTPGCGLAIKIVPFGDNDALRKAVTDVCNLFGLKNAFNGAVA
jgi:hypothetical protein